MNKHPVEEPPAEESSDAGNYSAVEEFIKLVVPEPELLEEESTPDPDIEPRATGA